MKLLVSPKDVEEAKAVIRGNADIVDVKNPKEGSLGANFPWVIRAIKELVEKEGVNGMEMSAAIGDFDYKPGTASLAALGAASVGADYIKIGLLKIKTRQEAIDLLSGVVKAVKGFDPTKKVVSAFYSDYKRINSISPFEITEIGKEVDIDVAMVDTGIKDGRSTLEFLSEEELKTFVSESKALGLDTALAGSLTFDDLPVIKEINPDILGVRGMVCGGDRNAQVRAELVTELRRKVSE
ncbi:MAG TPA: (5-formylfuran-3-yl)methyl phosphate synthase [Candidatus Bathyarchaeia archaeon]|nr:(5-formylfuran-3-yl)methyl phosphate synthase [Candidatus Bathyarchaeia archaeon]